MRIDLSRAWPFWPCVLLLAACAVPDTTSRVEELPEPPDAWSEAGGGADGEVSGDAWWLAFEDPELDALITEALERNLDLAQAAAVARAAREGAVIARSALLPSVDAAAGVRRQRQVFVGFPIPGESGPLSTTFTTYSASLQAAWELDLWDRLGSQERAAQLEYEAARADEEAARHALAAQVARSWFLLVEARLQHELAERTVESFTENERIVRDRYESGLVAALDLRSASANTRGARALAAERERALAAAKRSVDVLLGRYPAGELEAAADLVALPAAVPAGLPAELLGRRPDLRAAEARLRAAEEEITAAKAALYPSLTLTGSFGTLSNDTGDLLDGDFGVWSIGGQLVQPLFNGGRLRAGVRTEAARRDAVRAGFVQAFLVACAEVENALVNEGYLVRQVEELTLALEDSRVAESLSEQQYREGLVGLVTVLDTQRRALDAESALLNARRALLENRVSLHTALGGGFDALAPPPEDSEAGSALPPQEDGGEDQP